MTEQPVGPRCGNNPNVQLTDGDRKAVDDFKARLALRDRIAHALAEVTVGHKAFITVDVQAEYPRADAVLAVLPEPADRAAVYAEVADRLAADAEQGEKEGFTRIYRRSAAKQVREWADEAQQADPGTPRCGAWGGCPLPRGHNMGQADIPSNHRPKAEPAADPSWPRRAWDLGLLHKGGDPHHCPACLARPEPPADFICPGPEANAEVLANPQPAEEA